MSKSEPVIFLSVAEVSGDKHAAGLIRALKRKLPAASFVGAAGPMMKQEGCREIVDVTASATMLGGVLGKLSYFKRVIKQIRASIRDIRPDVLIVVDSPALNWHIAREAKLHGIPVVHYIAPQVWAWAPWRINKLRKLTDHVACLFPFEEEYFRTRDVPATFVGHPRFEELSEMKCEYKASPLPSAWENKDWKIAMLPGSRGGEISAIAPALSIVADSIIADYPDAKCTFIAADEVAKERIEAATERDDLSISVGEFEREVAVSDFAIVASGTATLEVASHGVPMLVVYNIGWWQKIAWALVVKRLVRTRHLSLVNILAQRGIVPEMMPWFKSPGHIAELAKKLLGDYGWLYSVRQKLQQLISSLKCEGSTSTDRTADIVIDIIEKHNES